MAKVSVTTTRIIGIALVVIGIGLAFWGYQLSDSVGSQITQAVTGSDTDKVMTFYITGAVSFVIGIYLSTKN
jgi:phosphate/sulfate permease